MSIRTTQRHTRFIPIGEIYHILKAIWETIQGIRTTVQAISSLRKWWSSRSAFDRHTIRVAIAHSLIGGVPAIFVGLVMALLGHGIPVQPLDNQTTPVVAGISSASLTFIAMEVVVLGRLKGLLRLNPSSEVIDEVIAMR